MICLECDGTTFKKLYNSKGDTYYLCKNCGVMSLIDSKGAHLKTFYKVPDRYIIDWVDGVCSNCSSHNIEQIGKGKHHIEYFCNMCLWTFIVSNIQGEE